MSTKLIEEENTVYEVDEACLREKAEQRQLEEANQTEGFWIDIQENSEHNRNTDSCMSITRHKSDHCCLWLIILFLCCLRR